MNFTDTFEGRPNTIRTYECLFRRHIEPLISKTPDWAERWEEASTRNMLREWEKKGLSRATKIALTRLLGRYVTFMGGPAIDTRKIIRNLERAEQQREVTALSKDEAQKLAETARRVAPKFYPVLLLALHAGLRRGEIFGLRCGDVDMLAGQIKVTRSYEGPTKNGKSRLVPMGAEIAKALTDARNLLLRGADEKVFEQFDPGPVLRRCCEEAGVRKIRFHDLRHSFASMALSSGVNPKQVSVWLGHSSVTTTLNIYWHLNSYKADLSFLPDCSS